MNKLYITTLPESYMDYENVCVPQAYTLSKIDSASCEEIIARDIIDTIPYNDVIPTILIFLSKVHRKGKITLGGRDLDAIFKAYKNQLLEVKDVNSLIFGSDRLSISSVVDIINILESNGFKILNKKRDNYFWSITAERQ